MSGKWGNGYISEPHKCSGCKDNQTGVWPLDPRETREMRWLILSSVSGELSSVQQVYFTDYIYKPAPQRHNQMTPTLVFATANPVGIADHHGLYLNPTDIQSMVTQIEKANMQGNPIPVHVEHVGRQIGKVVSAWETNGRLDCWPLITPILREALALNWYALVCARISVWAIQSLWKTPAHMV